MHLLASHNLLCILRMKINVPQHLNARVRFQQHQQTKRSNLSVPVCPRSVSTIETLLFVTWLFNELRIVSITERYAAHMAPTPLGQS
jgi:hypothetical protein